MAKRTQHTIGLDIGTSKVTCIAGEPGEGGLLEVVGIALCVWVWRTNHLGDRTRRRAFLHDGHLTLPG